MPLRCCTRPRTSKVDEDTEKEVLNEEFQCYMRVARSLLKTLRRQKDIEICSQMLRKLEKLNKSSNIDVKQYTNIYFKYALKILNWTSANQPMPIYEKWYRLAQKQETSLWLEEQKSYLAIKVLCDGSIIFYSAVTSDPCSGWVEGGLQMLLDSCEKKT